MTMIDDTTNVDALIQQLLMDPAALIDRVLRVVLQQAALDGPLSVDSSASPAELMTSTANSWVGQAENGGDATPGPPRPAVMEPLGDDHEELVNRNSVLAAALGACDCWGEDVDCPFCEGYGRPAWAVPDRRLFVEYVYPAVRALSKRRRPLGSAAAQARKRGAR